MGTPIYKITEYVNWKGTSPIFSGAGSGGGFVEQPVTSVLDGSGVAGQVAFWLDNNTLVGDDEFTYEFNSGIGSILYVKNIFGKDANDVNINGQDLTFKAGDAINGSGASWGGNIYFAPGVNDINGSSSIYFGGLNYTDYSVFVQTEGILTDVGLSVSSKNAGPMQIVSPQGAVTVQGATAAVINAPLILMGGALNTVVSAYPGTPKGYDFTLKGGYGANIGVTDGGDLYLCGGAAYGGGLEGKVYISDGANGKDIYAHDFILIP
jgi:hypothetical protein